MPTDAFLDGWAAHFSGLPFESNPYDKDLQAKSHNQWCAGWCERFTSEKHNLDLTYDGDCF